MNPLRRNVFFPVVLFMLAACDDGTGGHGAGGGGGDAIDDEDEMSWETYCEDVYCPQLEDMAEETGCMSYGDCITPCLELEPCAAEAEALRECAETAKLACAKPSPVDPSHVVLVVGECVAELNAQSRCEHGACDPFFDGECAPVVCPDGTTIARKCDQGTCVEDPDVACAPDVACTSETFTDVCPTLVCDGPGSGQACTGEGFCRVACE